MTFFAFHMVEEIPEAALTVVDALGLALLAVSGTEKALEFRLTPIAAVMMGGISGAGGYTIRDILLAQVPAILRVDFLATAAIIGAIVLVVARSVKAPANVAAFLGGATCFGLANPRGLAALASADGEPVLRASALIAPPRPPRKKSPAPGGPRGAPARSGWGARIKRAGRSEHPRRSIVPTA